MKKVVVLFLFLGAILISSCVSTVKEQNTNLDSVKSPKDSVKVDTVKVVK